MALFKYKAVSPSGETIEGQMEAASRNEMISKLQENGNLLLDAREASANEDLSLLRLFRKKDFDARELTAFTQQLATLLGAGQPLDRALQILIDTPDSERAKQLIERIRNAVRGGAPLSTGLEQQHGVFSRLYINMVRAGEVSGSLHDTLKRLADYQERTRLLRDSVISALIYPIILLVMIVAALFLLLTYVVPQFVPLFADMGAELPLITKFVLALGTGLQRFWWVLLLGAVVIVTWGQKQYQQADTRLKWDDRLLRLKTVGGLVARVETARLARTLGTLLENGVPLLAALSIARNVISNTVLVKLLDEATNDVKTGGSLAHALGKSKRFPSLATQMVAVGEESGAMDTMLMKVADTFDLEVKSVIDRLLAALVPALTMFMAVIVAFIMLAILLPILELSSSIS